jgi:hypothetical protein
MSSSTGSRSGDKVSLLHMARSVASTGALMGVSHFIKHDATPLDAVRWAAVAVLLGGAYYAGFNAWRYCRTRRALGAAACSDYSPSENPMHPLGVGVYTDVRPETAPGGPDAPSRPHLTMPAVYMFVYGWGVLLFVSLYCLSGLNEASSCWWTVGIMMLAIDELIRRDVPRLCELLIITLLWVSVVSVWWGSNGAPAVDESLGTIMVSVVLPGLTPVLFFAVRSSTRFVAIYRDAWMLCEVALPFMILLSVCVMLDTLNDGAPARRALSNRTQYVETPAVFGWNGTEGLELPPLALPLEYVDIDRRFVMLGVPFLAGGAVLNLVACVEQGYITEFVSSFMLSLSLKYTVTHDAQPVAAMIATGSAAVSFVVLVLLRRVNNF